MTINRVCRGDETIPLLFEVFDFDCNSALVGSVTFLLKDLKNSSNKCCEVLLDNSTVGYLKLHKIAYSSKSTFLDYIHSGVEISTAYAIDFSEYQGHTDLDIENNPYLVAVKHMQNVLQHYNQNPQYPVLGTGGIFGTIPVNCFALTANLFQPEIFTQKMLEEYYKTTLKSIEHSNNAFFSDIIEMMHDYVQFDIHESQKYFALIIISSGDPKDTEKISSILDQLVELPISIIIIKVPNDLIQYENLKSLKVPSSREMLKICEISEIPQALYALESHMIDYARFKQLEVNSRIIRTKVFRSSSLKLSPEKLRVKNTFFTHWKTEYLEQLRRADYTIEEIDEVIQLGTPFVISTFQGARSPLPHRNRSKTIVKQLSLRNSDFQCGQCKNHVGKLEEGTCGCKNFCIDCVKTARCLNCLS